MPDSENVSTYHVGKYGDWINGPMLGGQAPGYPVYVKYPEGGNGARVAWFIQENDAKAYVEWLSQKRRHQKAIEPILDDLFQNGFSEKAKLLLLVDEDGRDLGGRNRSSVRDVLIKHLRHGQ